MGLPKWDTGAEATGQGPIRCFTGVVQITLAIAILSIAACVWWLIDKFRHD